MSMIESEGITLLFVRVDRTAGVDMEGGGIMDDYCLFHLPGQFS